MGTEFRTMSLKLHDRYSAAADQGNRRRIQQLGDDDDPVHIVLQHPDAVTGMFAVIR